MPSTKAWLRVKADIEQFAKNPIEGRTVPAVRANPKGEVKMATRKQIAAARRNIKKAQAARRKKGRKRTTKRRRKRRRNATTSRKRNAWPNDRAGHRKAAKKGASRRRARKACARKLGRYRRKRNPSPALTVRRRRSTTRRAANPTAGVKVVKVPGATKVVRVGSSPRKAPARRSNPVRRRRKNPRKGTAIVRSPSKPTFSGLFKNPGPFTTASLKGWGVAAIGVGSGLYGADLLDRFVATRTPEDGNHPWYGADAAAAQRRRPDVVRFGAQAGLALLAMAATYFTRRGSILPWLFGGTSVGAGANIFKMGMDWWVSPRVFKVDDPAEESLANRLFPLEQVDVQNAIDTLFENWQASPQLAAAQTETAPTIRNPHPGGNAYVLGKAGKPGAERAFYRTGLLGRCSSCGGDGGCYEDCEDFCPPCSYNVGVSGTAPECNYEVKHGDNFSRIAALSGVDVNIVNSMNRGEPKDYWKVGANVKLPYVMCKQLANKSPNGGAVAAKPKPQIQDERLENQPVAVPPAKLEVPPPVSSQTHVGKSKEANAFSFGKDAE